MENAFHLSEKVGEIVSRFPKASDIFKEYKIDFCCGGDQPLSAVIAEQNLNENEVLQKLNQAYQEAQSRANEEIDWRQASLTDLIDHIVSTHHAYLQHELPQLSQYVTKILRVHGPTHGELSQVHKLFHQMKMELEQHLIKEEEVVFPLIKEYEKNPSSSQLEKTIRVIDELEGEHEEVGQILKELRAITDQYALPEGACRTYTLTFQKLEELESDLFHHIHLENNILFPRLEVLQTN